MSAGLWRVGGKVGRNIYLDDVEVAVAVGAEGTAAALARTIVAGMNAATPGVVTADQPMVVDRLYGPGQRTWPVSPPVTVAAGETLVLRVTADGRAEVIGPGRAPQCRRQGPDGLFCEVAAHHTAEHGAYAESGELVRW